MPADPLAQLNQRQYRFITEYVFGEHFGRVPRASKVFIGTCVHACATGGLPASVGQHKYMVIKNSNRSPIAQLTDLAEVDIVGTGGQAASGTRRLPSLPVALRKLRLLRLLIRNEKGQLLLVVC